MNSGDPDIPLPTGGIQRQQEVEPAKHHGVATVNHSGSDHGRREDSNFIAQFRFSVQPEAPEPRPSYWCADADLSGGRLRESCLWIVFASRLCRLVMASRAPQRRPALTLR